MTAEDLKQYEGRRISVKSRKLHNPVCGVLTAVFAGALIIYSEVGIFGIFPQDVTDFQEVLI